MEAKKVAVYIFGALLIGSSSFIVLQWPYFVARIHFLNNTQVIPAALSTPNLLQIASLGIEAPIQYPSAVTEDIFQAHLQAGVVHYPNTALPGQPGNTYIFGHSSDYVWAKGEYKNIFARLPEIEIGASITLTDQQGNRFTYTVKEKKAVSKDNVSVLQGQPNKHMVTLQTSYPLGTALRRYVVIGELE
jgi:LPXTG-site transpeptidase (sortase) family protein